MFEPGEPSTFEALGQKWTLSRFTARALRQWRDCIAGEVDVRGKLDLALRLADKMPEQAKALLDRALSLQEQLEKFSPACPVAAEYLATPLGLADLVLILLRPAHGDGANEDNILDILQSGGPSIMAALAKAQGKAPGGPAGNARRPGGPPG